MSTTGIHFQVTTWASCSHTFASVTKGYSLLLATVIPNGWEGNLASLWPLAMHRDGPNSRGTMHYFAADFQKYGKFHGKFTEKVQKINENLMGPIGFTDCYYYYVLYIYSNW